MSDLGDDARLFLAKARGAHDAPPGTKERVRAGLASGLLAPGLAYGTAGAAPTPPAGPAAGTAWLTLAKGALVLAIAGGGLALVLGPVKSARAPVASEPSAFEASESKTSNPVAAVAPPPASAQTEPAEITPPAPTRAAAVTPARPAPAPARAAPDHSVGAEIALLKRVNASLHAGDPKSALALVEEHARRFPHGALAEERDMERIVALCALDRRPEAERAQGAFSRLYPASAHDARIHAACSTPGMAPL